MMESLAVIIINGVLWIIQIFAKVNGHLTYVTLLWENETICLQNNHDISKWESCGKRTKSNICKTVLPIGNSTHNLTGEFFLDTNPYSDLSLNSDMADHCSTRQTSFNVSANTDQTECNQLKMCCFYEEIRYPSNRKLSAKCPRSFSVDSCLHLHRMTHMTYHQCVDEDRTLERFLRPNPDRLFWTSSYIRTFNNARNIGLKRIKTLNNTENLYECLDGCLNAGLYQKVTHMAYKSAQKHCRCYSKQSKGSSTAPQNSVLYAIRDKIKNPDCEKEEINPPTGRWCIAVEYRNSSVVYRVTECSRELAVLCGPSPNSTEKCHSYVGRKTEQPAKTKTTPKPPEHSTKTKDLVSPDRGMSDFNIGIIAGVGVLIFIVILLCVIKRIREKVKRRKPMERARPNSISNRTYHMQTNNPNIDEDEDVYTSITETADLLPEIRRPSLPPRNINTVQENVQQDVDYSTPVDAIVPIIDVYTDTYDDPLRKQKGIQVITTGEADTENNAIELIDIAQSKIPSAINGNTDNKKAEVLVTDIDAPDIDELLFNDSINEGLKSGYAGGVDGRCNDIASAIKDSTNSTNPYFTLVKQTHDNNCENNNNNNVTSTQAVNKDDSDYEDTSVINGNFASATPNSKPKQNPQKVEEDEKSLICTISPSLLKQLNIKIVPDDNEYAVGLDVQRKSSSNQNLNYDSDSEYDRLGYVKRATNDDGEKNIYNHVVMNKKEPDKTLNRRGTI